MRNPFRRRRIETPPEVAAALASAGQHVAGGMSHLGALALAAADDEDLFWFTPPREAGETSEPAPKPKREPAIHLSYGDTDSGPTTACGKYAARAQLTADPHDVTCGHCQRTRLYKTRTSAAAIPAAGTTRKQES